ncbi:MAG: hypothetical protein CVU44_00025 [Chloroflexi bacterium HGW-Chloroflexi-6]|nr:MAG: hypothetical protein CVU44_00025 [Chloroflexi bacterium HGW-Chloroflexi-6]
MKILYCWELGAGYGHLFRMLPITNALVAQGHFVQIAAPDRSHARDVFEPHGIAVWPAPAQQAPPRKLVYSLNYAQVLLRAGYWHAESLKERLLGWIRILETSAPDLVLAEHAPTALLAAQILGLIRAATGTGFSLPPNQAPMPTIQPWFEISPQTLLDAETRFLESVNPVLQSLGGKSLDQTADIFADAESFLCTLPELDHYQPRDTAAYTGPILYSPASNSPAWPKTRAPRIFMYMLAANRFFKPLLEALNSLDVTVLACATDLSEAECAGLSNQHIHITNLHVNLDEVSESCQLAILQGGFNAGAFLLLRGVPLLIIPLHLEQAMWGERLASQELGGVINLFQPAPDFRTKILTILKSQETAENVRNFSARYANFETQQAVQTILNRCNLLRTP